MKRKLTLFFLSFAFVLTANIAMAGPPALQTQYGPEGTEVDLIRAQVSGKVLSVAFNFRSTGGGFKTIKYRIDEVNYIDDLNSQKYSVLKDAEGKYSSGPITYDNEVACTRIELSGKKNVVAWYKFPLPPDGAQTVQINLPSISPFDGVEIRK